MSGRQTSEKIDPDNEVRVYKCDTWDKFIDQLRVSRLFPARGANNHDGGSTFGSSIYRGHPDPSYRLSSTIERKIFWNKEDGEEDNTRRFAGIGVYNEICEVILSRFGQHSRGLVGVEDNLG